MKQKPVPPALQPFLEGQVILVDKPLGWTSFDVVRKIRNLIKISKVGHAGTLDPLATGLLIVCTGKFTKQINHYMGMPKTYTGEITVGAVTPTYDLESAPEQHKDWQHLTEEQVQEALKAFTGPILQIPPAHSAIKQQGKPVYLAARKGDKVELSPRPVTIYAFQITGFDWPRLRFSVVCSTGTYIRSLAHDLGQALGTGAYLSALRRTAIGDFQADLAERMESFEQKIKDLLASEGQTNTEL